MSSTYDEERDGARLARQREAVWKVMRAGQWHTLRSLERMTGYPQPSISARLRDFRKDKYGAHTVLREYVDRGLWRYRLIVNREAA